MKLALVGDIGGTNARFALWKDQQLEAIEVHATADYSCPEDAIKAYLRDQGLALGAIGSVCLSVAGPVSGDEFRFTNNHWRLSRQAFCQALQVDQLLLVNDFSAMALGMTRLQPDEFRVVCEGVAEPLRPAVVIGPGTGLGVGTLLNFGDGRYMALPGEGGHVDLPLSSARETQLWQHIHDEIGHVSAETALSGGGLPRCIGRSARWTAMSRGSRLRRPSPRPAWPATRSPGKCWSSSAAGWAGWRATTC
ncbi:hypothetical protein PBOI14_60020 [Pseudomonas sp. Boi14]|nr:hypothetical protein PBOI14_60020 [Pseudomonas sp. Boi14]